MKIYSLSRKDRLGQHRLFKKPTDLHYVFVDGNILWSAKIIYRELRACGMNPYWARRHIWLILFHSGLTPPVLWNLKEKRDG